MACSSKSSPEIEGAIISDTFAQIPEKKSKTNYPIQVRKDSANQLDKRLTYIGKLLVAWSWEDIEGKKTLLISRTEPAMETTQKYLEGEEHVEIYAKQYLIKPDSVLILWKVSDNVRHCAFDMWLGLISDSVFITDLDSNGISETTFLYTKTCTSDVRPNDMKLIMHSGTTKMALRGKQLDPSMKNMDLHGFEPDLSKTNFRVDLNPEYPTWGRYNNAKDFDSMPPIFLSFAKKKWMDNIRQNDFLSFPRW